MDETADKIEALGDWNINKSSQTRFELVQWLNFSQLISPSIQINTGVVLWSFMHTNQQSFLLLLLII